MTALVHEVLRETPDYLVCYKPAGLATQTAGIRERDLLDVLRAEYPGEDLSVINRLDQPVEGLVLVARHKKAAAALTASMNRGEFGKEYLCVVMGTPAMSEGTYTDYMMKDEKTNLSRVVSFSEKPSGKNAGTGKESPRKAKLSYRVIAGKEDTSCLQVHLHTGRHHQIRVQMAYHGTPIVGDRKYGKAVEGTESGCRTVALCAFRLSFPEIRNGEQVIVTCIPRSEGFSGYDICAVDKIPPIF